MKLKLSPTRNNAVFKIFALFNYRFHINTLLQMFRISLCLFVWGIASCSITCPDGNICSDLATCCMTKHGYSCCPYPKVRQVWTHAVIKINILVWMTGRNMSNQCVYSCVFRLLAALTWPTAALQGLLVTWPPRCVRKQTNRGWTHPWWRRRLQRNHSLLFYLYLPFRSSKTVTSQTNKRVQSV